MSNLLNVHPLRYNELTAIHSLTTGTIGLPQSEVTSQSSLSIKFTLDSIYNRQDQCIVPGCVRFVLLITSSLGKIHSLSVASIMVICRPITASQ